MAECPTCQEVLVSGDGFIQAENKKKYHDYCFKCSVCKAALEGQQYYIAIDGTIICKKDFFERVLPTCQKCQKKIEDPTYEKLADLCYHKTCFLCDTCKRPFEDPRVILLGKKRLCYACAGKENVMFCMKCFAPIEDRYIKLADRTFHTDCAKCQICKNAFAGSGLKEALYYNLDYYHQGCVDRNPEIQLEMKKARELETVQANQKITLGP